MRMLGPCCSSAGKCGLGSPTPQSAVSAAGCNLVICEKLRAIWRKRAYSNGPRKALRSAGLRPPQLLTNEDKVGRRMRSTLHPNTKLSTSNHAQRSVSDALILDPRHLHRYSSAMETAPPRSPTPAHCSPATLRQRLGDSVFNCACAGALRLRQHRKDPAPSARGARSLHLL